MLGLLKRFKIQLKQLNLVIVLETYFVIVYQVLIHLPFVPAGSEAAITTMVILCHHAPGLQHCQEAHRPRLEGPRL